MSDIKNQNNNNIDNKIKNILDAIKDENTLDLSQDVADLELLRNCTGFFDQVEDGFELAIGTKLGHWTIKEKIGKGGMSVVYLAQRNDEKIDQQVALKVMQQGLTSQSIIDRFMREQQILSDLNHHNIAKLYDVGVTDKGVPWFVMELIQGQDILSYAKSNGLNIEQKIILFKQVCDALAYAHSHGVVHRDIKPGNLMVTDDKVVKLLDFGIASDNQQQSLTMTGSIMGTPGYMSPEQARGLNDQIDRRSDIFSAGVLLYKMIKDDMPFKAESISEISYKIIHAEPTLIGNDIPGDIQAIVFKCLEKKVENRYSSFKTLLNDLDAYLAGDVVRARKITWTGRCIKKIKKHPLLSAVISFAILLSFVGVGFGIYQSISSFNKVQLTKKYTTMTESLKNKIRRTHMMPLHNVQNEYKDFESEIEELRLEIEKDGIDDSGLSDFALGVAYQNIRFDDKSLEYFLKAQEQGWQSAELYSGLGELYANNWSMKKIKAKSIEDEEERKNFLLNAKSNYYQPAVDYLSKAQAGMSEAYFLKAHVAYIEEKYQVAIDFADKEIVKNPWHYEVLIIAANAYSALALAKGEKLGQDSNQTLIDLSNQMLEQAIQIGKSDPRNYIRRCAFAGRDIQNQQFYNYQQIDEMYVSGQKYCKDAQLLDPQAIESWIGLHNLHRIKAEYQKSQDRLSLNEYSKSISSFALGYYEQSLNALKNGLALEPQNFDLLLLQIKPLYEIAYKTYLNGDNPMPYYDKALIAIKKAQKVNLQSYKPWLEQAYIYSEITHYYLTVVKDLEKAETFANKAINSTLKANEIKSNYSMVVRINAYRYSLANVKYAQGDIAQASEILRLSIRQRYSIIPQRSAFFKNFNDIMRAQNVLVGLLLEIDQPIEEELEFGIEMIDLVCTFEGLTAIQKQQLETLIKDYVDNNWLKKDNFSNC